jgi:hypothetical protein
MQQTRKSLSSSMSNIILSCDVDPRFKSFSSSGKRVVITSSSATKRCHDGGTSIQGQQTSHNSNKEQQAPIDLCSRRGSTGFHESAR